jgi:SWI/SNF-related matrix-associated actin-dependent regulator 1 of chromatin subfamily A
LSGTPALARPAELFTQIKILDAKIFPNWTSYAKRYCDGKSGRFGFEAKGAEKLNELAAILHHSIMIR